MTRPVRDDAGKQNGSPSQRQRAIRWTANHSQFEGDSMNKLTIALILGTSATFAIAQTGTVNTATVGDHGTQAMHAAETARAVAASKSEKGLADTGTKRQTVNDATRIADHGTPVIRAADAERNVAASKTAPKPLPSDKAAQEAAAQAVKGEKK
jgi:hypothetical protein